MSRIIHYRVRPSASFAPLPGLPPSTWDRATAAYGRQIDLLQGKAKWLTEYRGKLDPLFGQLKSSATPFFKAMLTAIDAGKTDKVIQEKFWSNFTSMPPARPTQPIETAAALVDIHKRMQRAKAKPGLYIGGGFDQEGQLEAIYVGRSNDSNSRRGQHYARLMLAAVRGDKEISLHYASALKLDKVYYVPVALDIEPQCMAVGEGLLALVRLRRV